MLASLMSLERLQVPSPQLNHLRIDRVILQPQLLSQGHHLHHLRCIQPVRQALDLESLAALVVTGVALVIRVSVLKVSLVVIRASARKASPAATRASVPRASPAATRVSVPRGSPAVIKASAPRGNPAVIKASARMDNPGVTKATDLKVVVIKVTVLKAAAIKVSVRRASRAAIKVSDPKVVDTRVAVVTRDKDPKGRVGIKVAAAIKVSVQLDQADLADLAAIKVTVPQDLVGLAAMAVVHQGREDIRAKDQDMVPGQADPVVLEVREGRADTAPGQVVREGRAAAPRGLYLQVTRSLCPSASSRPRNRPTSVRKKVSNRSFTCSARSPMRQKPIPYPSPLT
jgi:hypothetical protein